MDSSRQEYFKQLRTPCVELSSVGLKFRGRQASSNEVLQALRPVHNVLNDLAKKNALDEKLAEYAFFPLSHIFNETQRISANCLEFAVNCLRILVAEGWRKRLSPAMGKQLMILLTLIVGGTPNKGNTDETSKSQPVELVVAGFDCLSAIFKVLEGPTAERTIYHEVGTATIVDQTVYVLLEGITDVKSDEICVSASQALETLYSRITDRVVLASVMPRTVSALVKVLKPSTQTRRSYKLLCGCLHILTRMLRTVLSDQAASTPPETLTQSEKSSDRIILDDSWLKATAAQMKLALANIIQIRRHERQEVQESLLELCLMVVEECQETLNESVPIVVDTLVVLCDFDEGQAPNKAFSSLAHTATVYPAVLDSLKNSLHIWITAFPRTMQNNDETAKRWALKQISTAFQILCQVQSGSDILNSSLASGLCDSVAAAVNQSTNTPQPLSYDASSNHTLEVLHSGSKPLSFAPVLLEHRSQQKTLGDLQSMIHRLNKSDSGGDITRLVIKRIHQGSGAIEIAPFWLALAFLKSNTQTSAAFDDFISDDDVGSSAPLSTRASMIEELYYISLPILNEPLANDTRDWRVSALALEVVALQAQQLGKAFRPELMDALYPVLQLLASTNSNLQKHAMTCLNILTASCNYDSTSTMIIDNVDYLVNSVALKLNTFDVSPYPPQVLFMMVKLCGARLIPYLDDLVDSIFGILDLYHGYPKLVEIMFKTLAAIVEEGTKSPAFLAIENGQGKSANHRKEHYKRLHVSSLAEDIANRKAKRAKYAEELSEEESNMSHPTQPWTTESENPSQSDKDINLDDALGQDESDAPLPPPREPDDQEKPLNKSHNLLLHIVKSIPSHLSSPSPYLRRSLLSILIQVAPILAAHENSFLPLINDVWPSVAARITFPTSLRPTSSSNSLMPRTPSDATTPETKSKTGSEELDFQEEIYVATTSCLAIEQMCKNAGDFMASRIEAEYPRWEKLYRRAWEKVSADAERALERRAQQEQKSNPTAQINQPLSLGAGPLTSSLSLSTTGSAPSGTRAFTPHHSLWRSLLSLFITILTHVRLPLSIGDQICEFLGAWIARFAGPEYYDLYHVQSNEEQPPQGSEIEAVEEAIQAMTTWNADLTWFIFQKQKAQVLELTTKTRTRQLRTPMIMEFEDDPLKTWAMPGSGLKFATLAF